MHSLRLGLALIIIGTALPLVCLPLLDGYRQSAGLLANIQDTSLPITSRTQDKMVPDFREVFSLDSEGDIIKIDYGKSGMTIGFPNSMLPEDIKAAMKAEPRFQKEKNLPKFMRFYGWKVAEYGRGVSIPFKYVTSFGLLLAFAGLILLVWRATNTRHETKVG